MAAEFHLNPPRIEGAELLDGLLTGVFLLDRNFRVDYVNAAGQSLLGVGYKQAIGRHIADLTRGAEALLPLFERALVDDAGVVQRELAWPTAAGADRMLHCAVTQITLGGAAPRLLLEAEDITQHRRLTRENALLAQLGGSRLMVRQLAHEIKNPLGGLRGAAQLLERELLDPALREYTRVIINEADRLAHLLDSMLGPGRPPAKQSTNLHELLERVYHLLRSEAPAGVVVERDYDPSLPPLSVDPNHIIQAMLNLGRNALQALAGAAVESPRLILRTRATSNVSVGSQRYKTAACIHFEDNGPGVAPDIRDTIFYPLVSGRSDGTGLGLGIAQDLVSRHGGLIEFDSVPGKTTFVISLPMDGA